MGRFIVEGAKKEAKQMADLSMNGPSLLITVLNDEKKAFLKQIKEGW
jgi:hypothetical protein